MKIKIYLAQGILKIVGLLPLKVVRFAGGILGLSNWVLKARSARTTYENLTMCFPSMSIEERVSLARNSLIETGKIGFETAILWRGDKHWLAKYAHLEKDEALITNALNLKKGVIVLAPHLGNWEVFGPSLLKYDQLTCLYRPPKETWMDELICHSRQQMGVKMAPTNRKGLGMLLKALRAGELVCILPDQVPDSGGIFSPFFNVQSYTMTLVHSLIQSTDCTVIAGFARRVTEGFEVHFKEVPPSIYSKTVSESVAGLNKAIEQCVALYPEQYQWEYKRFKVVPPGEKPRYIIKKIPYQ